MEVEGKQSNGVTGTLASPRGYAKETGRFFDSRADDASQTLSNKPIFSTLQAGGHSPMSNEVCGCVRPLALSPG